MLVDEDRVAVGIGEHEVGGLTHQAVREAVLLLATGLVLGGILAVAAARTAAALLFGLQPWDPSTLAASVIGLAAVAMLASYLPALRASRLEPTEALREE